MAITVKETMTVLRGECAKKFERQVKYGRPKKAAHIALKNGNRLMAEYLVKGYATITIDHGKQNNDGINNIHRDR